jgi:hypothetical protein
VAPPPGPGGPTGTRVLGRFDVTARTVWDRRGRLWVSPEELRVEAGSVLARDRVVRRDTGAEVRLGRRLMAPCILWRRPGGRRWRRLCGYPTTTEAVAPRALARAGWIDLPDGPWRAPDAFFQSCRYRRLARRGWCIVEPDAIRFETWREIAVVPRAGVRSVHVPSGRRAATVRIVTADGPGPRRLCRSFAAADLRAALAAGGWPLVPPG